MMYLGDQAVGIAQKYGKMASGNFDVIDFVSTLEITHNLKSRKIFFIAQLIDINHNEINNTSSRYQDILLIGYTKELLALDEEQTYSFKTGNAVSFSLDNNDDVYPSGAYGYFPADTNPTINVTQTNRADRQMVAVSDDAIQFKSTNYQLYPGHWVWRAYAFD